MSNTAKSDDRGVFEHAPNAMAVVRDGFFVDCNRAMLDLLGLSDKADFVGHRPGETFSPDKQPDGVISRARAQTLLQQCADLGRISFNWISKRSNGDQFAAQVLLRALDDSESPSIAVYIDDITQLKASQQTALGRKAYLQELLESSPVAYMVSELDSGRICEVNRAARAMMGLSDWECKTMRAGDLLANPADRTRFLRRLKKCGEASGEVVLKRPDGTTLNSDVRWRYNPGNENELLCWGVDITEFKRTQRELEISRDKALDADKAKSKFLSRMSHELRTPMNAILGFGQLLHLDKEKLTGEQNDAVEHILSAGEHLLEMIKDVLDFSRVNSGRVSLRIRRISTRDTVKASIGLIRPLANKAGVAVSAETHSLPDVLADAHWLRLVLVNLLSNAIHYNSRGGTVSVTGGACGEGTARIHVTDSGEGIRLCDAPRLFKPFERVSATRPEIEGTGIGLALCKKILELMGGSIGFESEPGKGTDFWFELPAFQNREDVRPGARARPCKILYIEEKLANIGSMVEVAKKMENCELFTATHGATGVGLARSVVPDLIVLDVDLPSTDGIEVIDLLRGDSATRDLPVYGLISDTETRRGVDSRMAAYSCLVCAPLMPEKLIKLIDERGDYCRNLQA